MDTKHEMSWTSTLLIKGKQIKFKLDTDAEIAAISEKTYQSLIGLQVCMTQPTKP